MIKTCTCEHKFQDEKYGRFMRIHNPRAGKNGGYRCTVCGKEKDDTHR